MGDFPSHGAKYLPNTVKGTITFESPVSFGSVVKGHCTLGYLSYLGRASEIYNTDIGRFCSIAPGLISGPTNHPIERISSHLFAFSNMGPFKGCSEYDDWIREPILENNNQRVRIGNDVWIGRNVVIKRGVTIGDGSIIGAGSIVVKDVPPYAIVGGVPAKFIRWRFDNETIARLQKLQWFNYDLRKQHVPDLDVSNIHRTLDQLETLYAAGKLDLLNPKRFKINSKGVEQLTD